MWRKGKSKCISELQMFFELVTSLDTIQHQLQVNRFCLVSSTGGLTDYFIKKCSAAVEVKTCHLFPKTQQSSMVENPKEP